MKTTLLLASLLLLPLAGHAACAPTDFAIKDFKTSISGAGGSARIMLAGELVNNCTDPSAAQIRIDAKDTDGKVVQSKEGWPAGTTNIAPGSAAKFDLGRRFRFQSDMATYTVSVIAVRAW
ncbi:hypothetical protein ACFPME_09350 [Rhodanobacter umsongensis]|uniref:Spore coat protein U domain-containing protein n=1 Tax=Rhodanobacter umsongensis TaxID=633153 RepID=A0ABW0JL80_9GAMM